LIELEECAELPWHWFSSRLSVTQNRLQQAVIGEDTIDAFVHLHDRPLKFAQVQLFFSSGIPAWIGTTDKNGGFHGTLHCGDDARRAYIASERFLFP